MPTRRIQRGPAAGGPPVGFQNSPAFNELYVDGLTDALMVGTGISGASAQQASGAKGARLNGLTGAATLYSQPVGPVDASFDISANILPTTATTFSISVTVAFTDESNTPRTYALPLWANTVPGFIGTIGNAGGAVAYPGGALHIRAKAGTTITVATVGTFTTVTYNAEAIVTPSAVLP